MTPNLSKVLYTWGLRDEVQKMVQKNDGLDLLLRKLKFPPLKSQVLIDFQSRPEKYWAHIYGTKS